MGIVRLRCIYFRPLILKIGQQCFLQNDHQKLLYEFTKGIRSNTKKCLFPVTRQSLENGTDPSKSFFFLFYKNHPKIPFKQQTKKNPKKTPKKADLPTLTFLFGHVTGNKHIFV